MQGFATALCCEILVPPAMNFIAFLFASGDIFHDIPAHEREIWGNASVFWKVSIMQNKYKCHVFS